MWELLQTDTNGDSCPRPPGKNYASSFELRRRLWGEGWSDIKNIERECSALQSACSTRLQSRHCSHSHCRDHCLLVPCLHPGNISTTFAKQRMNSFELIDSHIDFQERIRETSPCISKNIDIENEIYEINIYVQIRKCKPLQVWVSDCSAGHCSTAGWRLQMIYSFRNLVVTLHVAYYQCYCHHLLTVTLMPISRQQTKILPKSF